MRLIITMVISLVVFLGIATYSEMWISNTAQEISLEVVLLKETVRSHNWDEAAMLIEDIRKQWAEITDRWDIIVNHREMDEVNLALVRATKFIETESFDLALAEIAVIHHMVLHIAEKESLRLLNVF